MAVKARFSPKGGSAADFTNIAGYRISTFFHPSNGFNDNFFIYIHELISAENDLSSLRLSSPVTGRIEGTLTISDDAGERDYTFNNINLLTVQTFLTHEQKTRLLTFQYRAEITNNGKYCTLKHKAGPQDPAKVTSKMGKSYSYRIGGNPEALLFFGSRLTRESVEIFRMGALRNNNNSFLEMVMAMDQQIHNGKVISQTIFVKGLSFPLNTVNLQGLLVDESYGSFLSFNVSSLDTIAMTNAADYAELAKINFSTFTPDQYLAHAQTPHGIRRMNQDSSVETATIVLKKDEELDKSPLLV
ncbi:MAG: hypothetical protein P0Y53_19265 [Candidatus Pseudobacter hemicellulosilyticus]|uniref:Uncharacterized protein n=1 Tax=Candidatus Pseudobacter hemicellulosilyticus TaxID=3121375 RepID=A0AAJ5WQ03_9BACT|nr:MAG: hypothetical protein P0Y53_19265 [Pseudobacter sp.]